jgi:uncharacterized protein DUF4268
MEDRNPRPILISETGESVLERVPLTADIGASEYNEGWLRDLLFRHPEALPIAEINDSFSGLIPVCKELATPAGPIDVLYATPSGRIAVLEAKLWRNPEARRKVVGQILDYAKELSRWSYENLDAAVKAAIRSNNGMAKSLFDTVRDRDAALAEATFIDSVSQNLRRGDLLLLIIGDGIRENVGAITNFIEDHGTLHFTFGLVEMAIYRMPDGSRLVQPRILAQSTVVRRIVVDVRNGQVTDVCEEGPEAEDPKTRSDLVEQGRIYREFWNEFINTYPLDDSSQPLQPPTRSTNQFYYLSKEVGIWICAVIAPKGQQAGVYLAVRRGPVGDRIYAALSADRTAIDEAIGHPLDWGTEGEKSVGIEIWRECDPQMLTKQRAEVQAWLGDMLNRFVNAFRPRIQSLLKEQS